jgi:Tfp pilus assembly protein PilN
MNNEKILVLELSDKVIKLCRVKVTKRKKTIDYLQVIKFSHQITAQDISEAFSKFTKKIKYDRIVISVSRLSFLIRFLTIPSQDRKEIAKMLPFQLSKKLLFPIEEVVYDYSLVPRPNGYSKVILFIIQLKKIANVLEFIERNKIDFSAITITSGGLYNWFVFQEKFLKSKFKYPIVLVDVDKDCAQVLVADSSGIFFSRAFPYSRDEDLLGGINQSWKIFEKEFGKTIFNKIVFTGIKKDAVLEEFSSKIFIKSVNNFSLSKNVIAEKKYNDFSIAAVSGVSVASDLSKFDFLPSSLKKRRRESKTKRKYLKFLTVGVEIILICGMFLFQFMFGKYQQQNILDSQLRQMKKEVKDLQVIKRKVNILDKLEKGGTFSEIIFDVVSAVPLDTQLTLMDFKENGDFSIKGYAQEDEQVFAMKTYLNKSDVLEDVKIKYASKIKRDERKMVEFYIYGKRVITKDED